MKTKKIKEHNCQQFLDDLGGVSQVMAFAQVTGDFFTITKRELLKIAEERNIHYYISDTIFVRKRNVMVII